jgi:hypothetical protein
MVPSEQSSMVMRSGVAVLAMTPETKDEPGTQNDAAKKEEHAKEHPEDQSRGYWR